MFKWKMGVKLCFILQSSLDIKRRENIRQPHQKSRAMVRSDQRPVISRQYYTATNYQHYNNHKQNLIIKYLFSDLLLLAVIIAINS